MAHTTIETLKTMLAHLDDAKKYQSLRDVLQSLPAPDLAPVFEDLSPEKRPVLFRLCPKDQAAALFAELTPETQQSLIEELSDKELGAVVAALCADDAADLVEEMPAGVVRRILAQADAGTRRTINELLKYPQDSAGGVMTPEFMELRPGWTVRRAMAELRATALTRRPSTPATSPAPTARCWAKSRCARSCWKRTPAARCRRSCRRPRSAPRLRPTARKSRACLKNTACWPSRSSTPRTASSASSRWTTP